METPQKILKNRNPKKASYISRNRTLEPKLDKKLKNLPPKK